MFKELFDIFILKKPIKQMIAEKPTFVKAIIALVVVYLIIQIVSLVESLIINIENIVIMAVISGRMGYLLPSIMSQVFLVILLAIIFVPLGLVTSLISMYIGGGIHFIIAKLLGGKGTGYIQYVNNMLLLSAAITLGSGIIFIVISLLGLIPFIGSLIGSLILIPAVLAIMVYSLYLSYKLIKHYYGLSSGRAIIVLLVPVIIGTIILVIIFILFFAVIFALMASIAGVASGTTGYTILP